MNASPHKTSVSKTAGLCRFYLWWMGLCTEEPCGLPRFLRRHLDRCAHCHQHYQQQCQLVGELQADAPTQFQRPSTFLAETVRRQLDRTNAGCRETKRSSRSFMAWAQPWAVGLTVCLLLFATAYHLLHDRSRAPDPQMAHPIAWPSQPMDPLAEAEEWVWSDRLQNPLEQEIQWVMNDARTVLDSLAFQFLPETMADTLPKENR